MLREDLMMKTSALYFLVIFIGIVVIYIGLISSSMTEIILYIGIGIAIIIFGIISLLKLKDSKFE